MSVSKSEFRIGMLGCGVVGSQVARLLAADSGDFAARSGAKLTLAKVAVRDVKAKRDHVPAELITTDAKSVVSDKEIDIVKLGPLAALAIALTVISLMFQLIVFWLAIVKPDWQPEPQWLPLINEDCGTFNPVPNPPGEGPYYRFSRF